MANNGLDIAEKQFMKMKMKEQNLMLFKNIVHVRKKFKDYKIVKVLGFIWLFVLTAALGLRKYLPL